MEKKLSINTNYIIVAQFGKTRGIGGKIIIKSFSPTHLTYSNLKTTFLKIKINRKL